MLDSSYEDDNYDWYDVGGGGNCLFLSIANQLSARGINNKNYHTVRNDIANYIKEHWGIYEEFITDRDLESAGIGKSKQATKLTPAEKEKYINHLKKDGIWGDNISIKAAAAVFRVNIIIKSRLSSEHNVNESVDDAIGTIYIGHISELHYQSLFTKQKNLIENNGLTRMKRLYGEQLLQQLSLLKERLQLGLSEWQFGNEEDLYTHVEKLRDSLDAYKEKGKTKLAQECEKNLEPFEKLVAIHMEIQELQNILNEQQHANIEVPVDEDIKFEELKNSFTSEIQEQIVNFLNLTCLCPKNANEFLSKQIELKNTLDFIIKKLEQVSIYEENIIKNSQELVDHLNKRIVGYNSAFATEIRLNPDPAKILFGANKDYIPPKNIVETIYRRLSLYFHPDKMSILFVSELIRLEFIETFKIIKSTKEDLLKKGEIKASIDYYNAEGTKAFNLAVKFQHAKNGDFFKINNEDREEFRKIANKGNQLLSEHMCYQAYLAYSQYKEACKLADKHKDITKQVELRKSIAVCLYIQQDYLSAELYLCGALKMLVNSFDSTDDYFHKTCEEINKWKDKIQSATNSYKQKQPTAKVSLYPGGMNFDRKRITAPISVENKKNFNQNLNKDISRMAYELIFVSPDQSLAIDHDKIHKNYIAPLENRAYINKALGVTQMTIGGLTFGGALILGTLEVISGIATMGTTWIVPACYGFGVGGGLLGKHLLKKGNSNLSEPKLRCAFNSIIEISLGYYNEKNYQAFIDHLATAPAGEKKFCLIEVTEDKQKCTVNAKKIIEIMLNRGFQSTGIAYLLNLIAEVFLTNRVRFDGMFTYEIKDIAKNIYQELIDNEPLTVYANKMDEGVNDEISKLIQMSGEKGTIKSIFINLKIKLRHLCNRYLLEIPENYLKDAEKVPFSLRLQEFRNIARINLILLSFNNLEKEDFKLLRSMLNGLARGLHQMEVYTPNLPIRIAAIDDFITACIAFESDFECPRLSTLYADQEVPASMSMDLDIEEKYRQAYATANKEGATNVEKSEEEYTLGMMFLVDASRLVQQDQGSKIKFLQCCYNASKAFKKAIFYNNENINAYLKYIESLVHQYKFKDAKVFLLKYSDRLSSKPEFHLLLSESLKGLHAYDLALHKINEAVRMIENLGEIVPSFIKKKREILQKLQHRLNQREKKSHQNVTKQEFKVDKEIVLDSITRGSEHLPKFWIQFVREISHIGFP